MSRLRKLRPIPPGDSCRPYNACRTKGGRNKKPVGASGSCAASLVETQDGGQPGGEGDTHSVITVVDTPNESMEARESTLSSPMGSGRGSERETRVEVHAVGLDFAVDFRSSESTDAWLSTRSSLGCNEENQAEVQAEDQESLGELESDGGMDTGMSTQGGVGHNGESHVEVRTGDLEPPGGSQSDGDTDTGQSTQSSPGCNGENHVEVQTGPLAFVKVLTSMIWSSGRTS